MKLNPKLDTKKLAKEFSGAGRVQITDFLDAAAAEALHTVLAERTGWLVTFNNGEKVVWKEIREFSTMTGRRLKEMVNRIYGNAAAGKFQYIRHARPEDQNPASIRPLDPGLIEAFKFLKSKNIAGFLKNVTGLSVKSATPEAQWYKNDNFQTRGSDGPGAALGFSLSLSKNWNPDWGGNTFVYDDAGGVAEVFVPAFNSLELYDARVARSITSVTTLAREHRLSITGTFGG